MQRRWRRWHRTCQPDDDVAGSVELERGFDEQLAAFEEVISRYGDSTDPDNTPNLARAFYSKAFALQEMGRHTEAADAYDVVISRYGDSDDRSLPPSSEQPSRRCT